MIELMSCFVFSAIGFGVGWFVNGAIAKGNLDAALAWSGAAKERERLAAEEVKYAAELLAEARAVRADFCSLQTAGAVENRTIH